MSATSSSAGSGREAAEARIADLERKLQAARQELQARPRLQDLTPDELASEAVGAAGAIVKAARVQAFELREAAKADAAAAEQRLRDAVSAADEEISRKRAKATAEADALLTSARDQAASIVAQAESDAAAKLRDADASAAATTQRSQEEHDQLMAEAQARLNSTTAKAKAMMDAANQTSADILRTAREDAASVQAQAQAALARMVEEGVGRLRDQQRTLDSMAATYASMRERIAALAEQVKETAEVSTLSLSKAESQSRTTSVEVEQRVSETMALLDRLATPGSPAPAAE